MEGYDILRMPKYITVHLTSIIIARLALNYKSLPYKTQWVEYPDVAPTLKNYGIPPNSSDLNPNAQYSIPAACINGEYIMDSLAIAKKIEEIQPNPPLHLDSKYVSQVQDAVLKVLANVAPIAMPRVTTMLLNPSSAEYFEETRAKRFGMPLYELAKSEKARDALPNAQPALGEIKAILHENAGGPYILGKEPSFADFVLAGLWRFTELLDKDGDLHGQIIKFDGRFSTHYEACKQWMQKSD